MEEKKKMKKAGTWKDRRTKLFSRWVRILDCMGNEG